jgi:hypothetical protein
VRHRPRQPGQVVAPDDEVRAGAAADLVADHPADYVRVVVVADVEPAGRDVHTAAVDTVTVQRRLDVLAGQRDARPHPQAAQRGAVVVALEAALGQLPVRDQRQRRRAVRVRQRDVRQPVDVDDVTEQEVDVGPAGAGEQRERRGSGVGEQVVQHGVPSRSGLGRGGTVPETTTTASVRRSLAWSTRRG